MKKVILFAFLLSLTLFHNSCAKKVFHFASQKANYKRFDGKTISQDTSIDRMIAPYRKILNATMTESIGEFTSEMVKGKPSSSLTNFVCDAIQDIYQEKSGQSIDLVVQNFGGIRVNSIGSGPILMGEMYELMPFDNYLVTMDIQGKDLKTLFDKIAKSNGWPISKGSGFVIRDSSAAEIMVNNLPLDENKKYVLATSDYVANGGDDMKFMTNTPKRVTGLLIRDVIIAYVKKYKVINANDEKRISLANQ